MPQDVITSTQLTNLSPAHRGKVRDLYDLGDELLIVSTDRSRFRCRFTERYS